METPSGEHQKLTHISQTKALHVRAQH